MYIRWIKRGHKNKSAAYMTFYDAYLVESYRDEDDQPRQRTLSYLGNIREIDGAFSAIERELFLIRAKELMDNVLKLPNSDTEEMLTQLHRRIPPANYTEALRAFQENCRWFYDWCQTNNVSFPVQELYNCLQYVQKNTNQST